MGSRLAPPLLVGATFVAVSTATRALLLLRPDVAVGPGEGLQALAAGLGFDLVAACYVTAPMYLWLALVPDRLARTRPYRAAALAWFAAMAFGFLVLAVAEWLFWDEFGGRFNFIAVDYLLYTHEVLRNIWESYPVGRVLVALGAAALALTALLRRPLWRGAGAPLGWRRAGAAAALSALAVAGTSRWVDSDAKNFSSQDAANDLAGNGLYEFFAANRRNELDYRRNYATVPLEESMALVRAALGAPGEGVERHVVAARAERRLNVVLVSVESLGAEFLGRYGNRAGLTPNLDRLAGESLWFSRVFATGNRTVRGLEALTLALPPTPGQSIVRRPHNEALFSLGSVFEDKGYDVLFAYGGYGYFDNMNAFFEANDYRSVDRRGIPAERIAFENVWGVADEHLFDQVLDEIDRGKAAHPGRPVFAHVMTTSNHRPYTYPPGRIDIPSGTGRDGAVKYSDWAIGSFLDKARARPWFRDTLFVITADHGANARGTTRIPIDKYLIPLFVYAPGHVAPRRVDRLMSQIDIAPTVLGLLDFDYYSKFFGRDVLRSPPASDRAFVANYQTLGYLKAGRLVLLHPKRRAEVFRADESGNILGPVSDAAAAREAIAYYQAASHVFRGGLYRDEEQAPPERRAILTSSASSRSRRRRRAGPEERLEDARGPRPARPGPGRSPRAARRAAAFPSPGTAVHIALAGRRPDRLLLTHGSASALRLRYAPRQEAPVRRPWRASSATTSLSSTCSNSR
jgi:phosphoglycerol transferase MdoB-like AlkP superfamily enzyme